MIQLVKLFILFQAVGTIVCRVRDFIKHINGSPQLLQKFEMLADLVASDIRAKKMVQDVATRWNSTLAMLKRAFSLRKVIAAYLDSDVELQRYVIMEHEWALVQEVIKLLEPLEEVFEAFSVHL